MRMLVFLVGAAALLAGCSGKRQYPEGWQQQKQSCVSANFDACADIGHQVRNLQGGPTPVKYPPFSQPIVD